MAKLRRVLRVLAIFAPCLWVPLSATTVAPLTFDELVAAGREIVVGVPQFRVGDRDVLFVGSRNDVSPVVGVMQGAASAVAHRSNDAKRIFTASFVASSRSGA